MDEDNQPNQQSDPLLEEILKEYRETGKLNVILMAELADNLRIDPKTNIELLKQIEEEVKWDNTPNSSDQDQITSIQED